jgi:hypothetical protein
MADADQPAEEYRQKVLSRENVMNAIDHNALINAELYPCCDDEQFLAQMRFLREINIEDQDEVNNAIRALEILKTNMIGWSVTHKSVLEPDEMEKMMQIYDKRLTLLRQNAGLSFERALTSYRICLRIFQFVMSAIYDYPDEGLGRAALPDAIRELA